MAITSQFLTDIQNSFTAGKPGKFPTRPIYYFPPYFQYVTVYCRTALRNLKVRVLVYLEENADENVIYFDFRAHTQF